jgi:hypothetical protein
LIKASQLKVATVEVYKNLITFQDRRLYPILTLFSLAIERVIRRSDQLFPSGVSFFQSAKQPVLTSKLLVAFPLESLRSFLGISFVSSGTFSLAIDRTFSFTRSSVLRLSATFLEKFSFAFQFDCSSAFYFQAPFPGATRGAFGVVLSCDRTLLKFPGLLPCDRSFRFPVSHFRSFS